MRNNDNKSMRILAREIRACELCSAELPMGPRPVIQVSSQARILIAGQAPGTKVHETGLPFDDASGDRLRDWMGIDRSIFYDPQQIACVPMGFCYPGKGKSGDLPPIPRCATTWRDRLMAELTQISLTLVIGQYAQAWHLSDNRRRLTDNVMAWEQYVPSMIPLPHPSPRNNIWLRKHPWFEADVLPYLKQRVQDSLAEYSRNS